MLKKILEKIELVHIVIIIFILSLIIMLCYSYTSTTLQKFDKKDFEIIELEEDFIQISQLENEKSTIECSIPKKELDITKYHNYISGEGEAIKVDLQILIKDGDNYSKIKTLQTLDTQDNINIIACARKGIIKEDTKIAVYNLANNKIYEFKGEG